VSVAARQPVQSVQIPPRDFSALRSVDPENYAAAEDALRVTAAALRGRAVWHLNFSSDDGVADMLRSLVGYSRGSGIDSNWMVGSPQGHERLVRRFYDRLYGTRGDEMPLDEAARRDLERLADEVAPRLLETVQPGDIVYLHDPAAAGLIAHVKQAGAAAIWRCHVGWDDANEHTAEAQALLLPLLEAADAVVFTYASYVWPNLEGPRVAVIQPSLDPFNPKNRPVPPKTVSALLRYINLIEGQAAAPTFMQLDGSRRRVEGVATIQQSGPIPNGAKQVTQVSGWERQKDPPGLVAAFAGVQDRDAHLIVAGPEIAAGGTNEEAEALADAVGARQALPPAVRDRVHLVELPMAKQEENGLMVNALQRSADVIVHKSLRESFGLSVTEAMWKEKPVVASAVGGIRNQIQNEENGILVPADDLNATGAAIDRLLADEGLCLRLAMAAGASVRTRYLPTAHMSAYLELLRDVAEKNSDGRH
jgi:trehalose synthase